MTPPAEAPREAGRELDALIAEKVMGFRPQHDYLPAYPRHYTDADLPQHHQETPRYSTDIAAAWQVVEKLMERAFDVRVVVSHESGHSCFVRFGFSETSEFTVEDCESAPLAICRAALLAVEPTR